MNKIVLCLLLLLSMMQPIYGAKVQTSQSWVYTDSRGRIFNETVTEIVQFAPTTDLAIATAKIQTNRIFEFPYLNRFDLDMGPLDFNLSLTDPGELYITQEGGYPMFSNGTWDGIFTLTLENTSQIILDVVQPDFFIFDASPSESYVTAESTFFSRYTVFPYVRDGDLYLEYVAIREYYIISTNHGIKDTVRNYTVSPASTTVYYSYGGLYEAKTFYPGSLSLSSSVPLLMTYDQELGYPTYIRQTEPAVIEGNLGLNQVSETVEYFLVQDDSSDSSDSPLPLLPIMALLVLIPVVRRIFSNRMFVY